MFIKHEATDALRNDKRQALKSKAEAKLKNDCGSVMLAKLIWKVGLPDIKKHRDSIKTDTEKILKWLSMVANEITEHKATPEYQEQARKSGTEKNRSGLNEMERSRKEERKRAARIRYGRHPPHPKILKLGGGYTSPPHPEEPCGTHEAWHQGHGFRSFPLNFAILGVHAPQEHRFRNLP